MYNKDVPVGRVPRLLVVEVDGGFQLQWGKHFFRFVGQRRRFLQHVDGDFPLHDHAVLAPGRDHRPVVEGTADVGTTPVVRTKLQGAGRGHHVFHSFLPLRHRWWYLGVKNGLVGLGVKNGYVKRKKNNETCQQRPQTHAKHAQKIVLPGE